MHLNIANGTDSRVRVDAWARATLRAIWLVALPLVLTGLLVRYGVPSSEVVVPDWARPLARFAKQSPVEIALAVFLLMSWIARYWLFALPGGRHLAGLPYGLARRIPLARLQDYAAAADLDRRLAADRKRKRREPLLGGEATERIDGLVEIMRAAIEADDPLALRVAKASLEAAARPLIQARRQRETLWFAIAVFAAAALALVLRAWVAATYSVLSSSMLPGLEPGDRIAVSRGAYASGVDAKNAMPRRGDVIVFAKVEGDGPDHLVKRVIGLPGDRIGMYEGAPVINGWVVPRCDAGTYFYPNKEGSVTGRLLVEFLEDSLFLTIVTPLSAGFDGAYEVQPGEVFVLGDNRNNSLDSRAYNEGRGGGVPLASIQGQAKWFVLGTHRSGQIDVSRFLQPLGLGLHLEGVDIERLERGIERCLAQRPTNTSPPPPHAAADAASPGGDTHAASR